MGSRAMPTDDTDKAHCAWEEVPKSGDCGEWVNTEDWILTTSLWNDTDHFWRDIALWRD